ncbi:MAG: hypothetical protein EXR88_03550 [Gammaproteobacteria bacterium]|nr:hypothetical protein [Gammaproteobacteria bacterium]
MQIYGDTSGTSGIESYLIGDDFINVKFKAKPKAYPYTNLEHTKHHIYQMKVLASQGRGLGTYINQHLKISW